MSKSISCKSICHQQIENSDESEDSESSEDELPEPVRTTLPCGHSFPDDFFESYNSFLCKIKTKIGKDASVKVCPICRRPCRRLKNAEKYCEENECASVIQDYQQLGRVYIKKSKDLDSAKRLEYLNHKMGKIRCLVKWDSFLLTYWKAISETREESVDYQKQAIEEVVFDIQKEIRRISSFK